MLLTIFNLCKRKEVKKKVTVSEKREDRKKGSFGLEHEKKVSNSKPSIILVKCS